MIINRIHYKTKKKLPSFADSQFYPRVTIITVVKNSQKHLERTIKSVLNQKYKNIEHIIVDGNSTDNTGNIIKKYQKKIDLYIKAKDKNLWDAMNLGILNSKGSIIVFLNSDDIFYPNAVLYAVNYLKSRKVDFVFVTVFKYSLKQGFNPIKFHWTFSSYTTHSVGFFIKKKAQMKIGLYDTRFLSADLDLFLRMIKKFKLKGVASKKNEVFGKFRPGGFSTKIGYKKHLRDLNEIRINNNQFYLYVYIIYIYKIIKNFKKFIISK
jgi:glycosyltransferase involved in cell wall biosynthesis